MSKPHIRKIGQFWHVYSLPYNGFRVFNFTIRSAWAEWRMIHG
jgi:hypothetical protein